MRDYRIYFLDGDSPHHINQVTAFQRLDDEDAVAWADYVACGRLAELWCVDGLVKKYKPDEQIAA
jgi:hypothetical protein